MKKVNKKDTKIVVSTVIEKCPRCNQKTKHTVEYNPITRTSIHKCLMCKTIH